MTGEESEVFGGFLLVFSMYLVDMAKGIIDQSVTGLEALSAGHSPA